MAGTLDDSVVSSVSNANLKNLGDAPAFYAGILMSESVSHQAAMNRIREASVGSIVEKINQLDPTQAMAMVKAMTGDDIAQKLLNGLVAVAGGQQEAKIAQSTRPETGAG